MDRDIHCNTHSAKLTCTCYRPDDIETPMKHVSCEEKFMIVNSPKYVVRIKTALSIHPRGIEYVDELLAEVIYRTCHIPKSHIYILRKTCDLDAMYIYLGIFSDPDFIDYQEIKDYDVRMIFPEMLYSNHELLEQTLLPIWAIDQVMVLPPIKCPICNFLKAKEILDGKAELLGIPKLNLSWTNEPSTQEQSSPLDNRWSCWEHITIYSITTVSVTIIFYTICRRFL
ncbi:unnamed protein product [Bursaphelenchus xylophilus]|uniref:(pine wood nematode) hypothetical protein n=1 Tax=Bursaphelenchus xylophilus TaxID=6326 RepID=A0A1I7S1P2_BURXY|nr:unnamed protein product [Bursaphelenchus xylophilus]CAG9081187.1 unnamed protein product [Bursaphelenchus xylophilus]